MFAADHSRSNKRASFRSAIDRRAVLAGLATLPLASGPVAASAEAEPIVAMHRRFVELQAVSDALSVLSDEVSDEAWDRTQNAATDLTERSLAFLPTTLPGAAAALAWARWEFGRHYVETGPEPDWMDRWTLAMMDAALDVLRSAIEGGRAHG